MSHPNSSKDQLDDEERERIEEQIRAISKASVSRPMPTSAGDALCFRCLHAHIYRRRSQNDVTVICQSMHPEREVPDDIVECSNFRALGKLSDEQMMSMAVPISDREYKGNAGYR